MQKLNLVLTAALLMSGAGFAQEKSESVEDIFKDLISYQGAAAPAVVQPAPVVEAVPEPEAPASAVADVAVEPAPELEVSAPVVADGVAEAAVEPVDAESGVIPLEAAEIATIQQSVAEAVTLAPESIAARIYSRTLRERDQRTAEIQGMKAVDAAWSTELVFRSYSLGGNACEEMGMETVDDSMDVSHIFHQVDFPKGSSAIYQPTMEALFVRNTRENLAVLEAVMGSMGLAGMSVDTDQVEIEAKFVEVSEGTLEELGFEWRSLAGKDINLSDGVGIPGGHYLFDDALRGGPGNTVTPGLPFSRPSDLNPDGFTAGAGAWSAFRFEDTFNSAPDYMTISHTGGTELDLLISALDQSSGTDVLSAPRIVTRSGEEATLRVGELHYFPEVFEGESDQGTFLSVAYQDFEEKLLGVELVVTPEVDGDQINLFLNPKITELVGWQSYQMAPANSLYNHRQSVKEAVYGHVAVVAKLPIYKKRSIETYVTIASGSTIGMGGLISEKIEAFEDKVPVLGSLPLVGRLFRNEGERAVKRNLLMFVTVNKVDPSGRITTTRSFE